MSGFPVDDWQFWVASAIVLVAGWFVIGSLIPRRRKGPACPNCPGGSGNSSEGTQKSAQLTVDGRRVS